MRRYANIAQHIPVSYRTVCPLPSNLYFLFTASRTFKFVTFVTVVYTYIFSLRKEENNKINMETSLLVENKKSPLSSHHVFHLYRTSDI